MKTEALILGIGIGVFLAVVLLTGAKIVLYPTYSPNLRYEFPLSKLRKAQQSEILGNLITIKLEV